jgi:hypothetical protein
MLKRALIICVLIGSGVAAWGTASGAYGCGASQACIYDNNGFSSMLAVKNAGAGLSNVGAGQNDRTDSWRNESNSHGAWYYNTNGGGDCYNMLANSSNSNLGWAPSDELSSWRLNGQCN